MPCRNKKCYHAIIDTLYKKYAYRKKPNSQLFKEMHNNHLALGGDIPTRFCLNITRSQPFRKR